MLCIHYILCIYIYEVMLRKETRVQQHFVPSDTIRYQLINCIFFPFCNPLFPTLLRVFSSFLTSRSQSEFERSGRRHAANCRANGWEDHQVCRRKPTCCRRNSCDSYFIISISISSVIHET